MPTTLKVYAVRFQPGSPLQLLGIATLASQVAGRVCCPRRDYDAGLVPAL